MNILFATVNNIETNGNAFLEPHFKFNPSKHYQLTIPGHELDLIPNYEIKKLRKGEPYFCFSKNQLTISIKNGNASKMLLLWKGRKVKILEFHKLD